MTDNSKSQSADMTEWERLWTGSCATALAEIARISSSMLAKRPAHMSLNHPLSKASADILHLSMSALTQGIAVSPTSSNDTETKDASPGPSPATDARTDPLTPSPSTQLTPGHLQYHMDRYKRFLSELKFLSELVVDFPTASDKK